MRFFKIDGEKNEKQLSVRLNDMSVQNAVFRRTGAGNNNNTEVLACGRKPFFYSYDTESGNVSKIPGTAHEKDCLCVVIIKSAFDEDYKMIISLLALAL